MRFQLYSEQLFSSIRKHKVILSNNLCIRSTNSEDAKNISILQRIAISN